MDSSMMDSVSSLKKELERQLEVEYRKKDALLRLDSSKQAILTPKKGSKTSIDYDEELESVDRSIAKLRDALSILNSVYKFTT